MIIADVAEVLTSSFTCAAELSTNVEKSVVHPHSKDWSVQSFSWQAVPIGVIDGEDVLVVISGVVASNEGDIIAVDD